MPKHKAPDRGDEGLPEDRMKPFPRMEFKLRAEYCREFRRRRRKEYPSGLLQELDPGERPSTIGMYDMHEKNRKVTKPGVDPFDAYYSAFPIDKEDL